MPSAPVSEIPFDLYASRPSAPVSDMPLIPIKLIPSAPVSEIPLERVMSRPANTDPVSKLNRTARQSAFFINRRGRLKELGDGLRFAPTQKAFRQAATPN